jgi:hypothetical protein
MYFLIAAGLVCLFAPNWILCASGMGSLEDEPALQWMVRGLGLILLGVAGWAIFARP